eukprot:7566277-Pyramimonas_sp.AAC.1
MDSEHRSYHCRCVLLFAARENPSKAQKANQTLNGSSAGREDTHWLQHGDRVVLFTMDRVPYTVCPLGVHTSDFQIRPDEAAPYRDDGYFFNTP